MSSILFGELGSFLGGSIFGGFGEALGYKLGSHFGRKFQDAVLNGKSIHREGSRLDELTLSNSIYGKVIPIIYGLSKIQGKIIWTSDLKEVKHHHSKKRDIFGIHKSTENQYEYNLSLAIAICEGVVDELIRVYINGDAVPLELLNYRFYQGNEDQMPDPLITKIQGEKSTPAYRGLCYIVIENLPLKSFDNKIPNFAFEIRRKQNFNHEKNFSLASNIEAMVVKPGLGEFSLDTTIQQRYEKIYLGQSWERLPLQDKVNLNNDQKVSDAKLSLTQLKNTCANLKWLAVNLNWFMNSNDADNATISPRVEFTGNYETEPNEWKVANYTRKNTQEIKKNKDEVPIYSSTPSDQSLINYIEEARKNGFKIMFYPHIVIDHLEHIWSGNIISSLDKVKHFFEKNGGYNEFILHYARLLSNKVDAFIIGTELKGLTAIHDQDNNFPAVDNLINLAKKVRDILGENVKISYAASWQEYHHEQNGWYNLDKLWSSQYIDFVGINAFYPFEITNKYDQEDVIRSWTGGEGYHYSQDENEIKMIEQEYAQKNFNWWWENYHINPDGRKSSWIPRSKKIWFTSFGYPSANANACKPFIPVYKQVDSKTTRHNKADIDYEAQMQFLSGSIKYLKQQNAIEEIFLWYWDSRPYPFWPDFDTVWMDRNFWASSYCLNGKIGSLSLSSILTDICSKVGMKEDQIEIRDIYDRVEGYTIDNEQKAVFAIVSMQKLYFFDIFESQNKIVFSSSSQVIHTLDTNDLLLMAAEGGYTNFIIEKDDLNQLPSAIKFYYVDSAENFDYQLIEVDHGKQSRAKTHTILANTLLSKSYADFIAKKILQEIYNMRTTYKIMLPIKYLYINVGERFEIKLNDQNLRFKIVTKSVLNQFKIEFILVKEYN